MSLSAAFNRHAKVSVLGLALIAGLFGAGVAAAAPASAGNCSQSWQRADWQGNPLYNCGGTTYKLTKPLGTNRWNDPWGRYQLQPQYGFGNSQQCRYSSWNDTYNCR